MAAPPPSYESVVGWSAAASPIIPRAKTSRPEVLGSSMHAMPDDTLAGGQVHKFQVSITDPVKHGDALMGYTLYRVTTQTTMPEYPSTSGSYVLRRYSDFEWLHLAVRNKLPGCIPPPLPEKIASGRFEQEFVEQRMSDLGRFINKMANNPLVQPLPELTAFLTETSAAVWDNRAAWYEKGTVAKVMSSMSSWFNQMSVTAEGAYFSKGIQTVIKAEDPEYLDVVDYFVNLEGRLMLMRDNVARLSRAYMSLGALWGEFGAQAVAVGATEEASGMSGMGGGDSEASQGGQVNSRLSHAFLQLGDAAESLHAPWVKSTKGMMQLLIGRICEYLLVVGAVKEAIDERANALIEYQSACCVYDDKVQAMARLVQKAAGQRLPSAAPSREVATHELDVANAAAKRDDAKHRYDSICERMKVELPRIYAGLSVDLNEAFGNFLAVHSQLSTQTAAAWNAVQPGCGTVHMLPNVKPVLQTDDTLTSDTLSASYHSGLTAMGYTQ